MRTLQAPLIACLLSLVVSLPASAAQASTLCELPKEKVLADLSVRLDDRYPTNEGIRKAQIKAADQDYDALCSNPIPPGNQKVLAELTKRHYPSVTLIRSFYESLTGEKAGG